MNKVIYFLLIFFVIIGILVTLKILIYRIVPFINQYVFTTELDLPKRYGSGSWVLITGASSGMGERFAWEFAQRGFNLLLVGSKRTKRVIQEIEKRLYVGPTSIPMIKFIEVDFADSFKDKFFDPIQNAVDELGDKWSILVNNVGMRVGCEDYSEMPIDEMKKTISVGTLVQAKLTQMALQKFKTRKRHTAIVSITALNSYTTDFLAVDNEISVPYLACYEASNAFGHFHAKSVYEEIRVKYPQIDYLVIMPGAVLTKHTELVLRDTIFAVNVDTFVKNILRLMGNANGTRCAYFGHSLTSVLVNIFPWVDTRSIAHKIGRDFAKKFRERKSKSL